ncbi:MAG: uracil-DNA glycosylase family protein, partial [Asgard group archaeon]
FKRNDITPNIEGKLFNVIFWKTYWTHMHKCFTNKFSENTKFKHGNAVKCADKWLEKELEYAISDKTRFIIALGNDVQTWFQNWRQRENKGIKIINLIHPSGQNNRIWYRSQKDKYKKKIGETEEEINNLIELCKGIHF